MGASRSRRRLRAASRRARTERDLPPVEPVAWPSAGSGFEADPSSPAGQFYAQSLLITRAGRTRAGRVLAAVALVVILASVVWGAFGGR
jgi:hypothetical protein